ncbi:MAG: hypothetical protein IJO20_01905 [Ruminococcus sp.]|nr:hypothetical protein [Ruminococcus sp.]
MNQSQKTSSFLRAINKYAKEQSEAIRLEAEEFRKQEIEKATKEGLEDAHALILKEISSKKALIISDVAKREQESRRTLFVKRNEIVESVFADAKEKLTAFTKSEAYAEYLRKSAKKIAEVFENKACVIYIRKCDMNNAELIKENIKNCEIITDNKILLGGIKGYCEELSLLCDDTLDTKLSDERARFAETSGLKVV